MKHLLKCLIRLYPQAWRKRYEEEFGALIEDLSPRWSDLWDVGRQAAGKRWNTMTAWQWIVIGSVAGLVFALVMIFQTGPGYLSHGQIQAAGVQNPAALEDLIVEALTPERLLAVMERHSLYVEKRSAGREQEALDEFRKQITVGPVLAGKDIAGLRFAIIAPDAARAQKIGQEFAASLIDLNLAPRASWSGMTLKLVEAPRMPAVSVRWLHGPTPLISGAVAGAVLGFLLALAQAGWKRLLNT